MPLSYRQSGQRLPGKIQIFDPEQAGNGRTKIDVLDRALYHIGGSCGLSQAHHPCQACGVVSRPVIEKAIVV
jgi:hypothetical protein